MKKIIMDNNKVDNFWTKRAKVPDPRVSTHFKKDDTHVFDLKLIRKFITSASDVLDLGCGTCYLANEIVDDVHSVMATDKYPEFLKHCKNVSNMKTKAIDILNFTDDKQYDVILLFGVIMYFGEEDTKKIYKKCKQLLKKNGTLIVKHQCGVNEDVMIDNYSKTIGDNYYAVYKHVNKDKELLEEFFKVKVIDVYPKRLNPWKNTHFYAFIGKHK